MLSSYILDVNELAGQLKAFDSDYPIVWNTRRSALKKTVEAWFRHLGRELDSASFVNWDLEPFSYDSPASSAEYRRGSVYTVL
ncbi:uncharacterized protein KD926_004321 [Aspergillus affinis]|uniref:uncharacterized protein n=1 Tax=Aspergillus affinis TaxID=1070780 RepID=UPI0022FDD3E7|nr:uncharacterized protein KD926_004321 [Aspergillus affinis]KAI9043138.1 hypothetical protein KD926_004321 [Aspergillus affinis]